MIYPSISEVRQRAYELWQERGAGFGHAEVDWVHAEWMLRVEKNYDLIEAANFDEVREMTDRPGAGDRICRYCCDDENATSFAMEGHAISAHWGSNLITLDECDRCNQTFGRCESTFGQFSAPIRAYMRTVHTRTGRKNVPASDFAIGSDGVKRFVNLDEHGVKWVEPDYTAVKSKKGKIQVAKSLVKYGLAIMPGEMLRKFEPTIAWIRDENHDNVPGEINDWITLVSATPSHQGHWYEDKSEIRLYTSKMNHNKLSGTLLLFRQASFALQISIPLSTEKRFKMKSDVLMIPPFTRFDQQFGLPGVPVVSKELSLVDPQKLRPISI